MQGNRQSFLAYHHLRVRVSRAKALACVVHRPSELGGKAPFLHLAWAFGAVGCPCCIVIRGVVVGRGGVGVFAFGGGVGGGWVVGAVGRWILSFQLLLPL